VGDTLSSCGVGKVAVERSDRTGLGRRPFCRNMNPRVDSIFCLRSITLRTQNAYFKRLPTTEQWQSRCRKPSLPPAPVPSLTNLGFWEVNCVH
jgi:hypothetical protein